MYFEKGSAIAFLDIFGLPHISIVHDRIKDAPRREYVLNRFNSLEGLLKDVTNRNAEGYGIFFTPNEIPTSKRKDDNVTQFRAVFADDDELREAHRTDWPLEPSIIVNTSKGKFHYYWIIDNQDRGSVNADDWVSVQASISTQFGTDNKVKNPARIMRLPGFHHNKGTPYAVTFTASDRVYLWSAIQESFARDNRENTHSGVTKGHRANHQTASRQHSFQSTDEAKESIRTGESYHDAILFLLDSWANHETDPDVLLQRIEGVLDTVDPSLRDSRYQSRCDVRYLESNIRDALKFTEENPLPSETQKAVTPKTVSYPKFPKDTFYKWPEPWPMIWEHYKRVPMHCEQELLAPTMIASCAYALRGNYVTEYGRLPNFFFINVAPSAGHKDMNSRDVLTDLHSAIQLHNVRADRDTSLPVSNIFTSMLMASGRYSSDTAYVKALAETGEMFWINTEASRIFDQIDSTKRNQIDAVMALSEKLIEAIDGKLVTGKRKAQESVESIHYPNVQTVFFAQPETIERYLSAANVDSGLIGRADLHFSKSLASTFEMFPTEHNSFTLDEDFIRLFSSPLQRVDTSANQVKVPMLIETKHRLNEWYTERISRFMGEGQLRKILSRLSMTTEKLYCVVVGVCREWDKLNNTKPRQHIDVSCLLPYLDYLIQSRLYAYHTLIEGEDDAIEAAIIECIGKMLEKAKPYEIQNNCVNKKELCNHLRRYAAVKAAHKESRIKAGIAKFISDYITDLCKVGVLTETMPKKSRKRYIGVAP